VRTLKTQSGLEQLIFVLGLLFLGIEHIREKP